MSKPTKPVLGALGILREALKLPRRNVKLVTSIVLLLIFPCNLAVMAAELCIRPFADIITFLSSFLPSTILAEIQDDYQHLWEVEPVSFILWQLLTIIIVYLSAMVYVGIPLTTREFFSRIGRKWKRVIVTLFYTQIFTFAYASLITVIGIYVRLVKSVSLVSALALLLANMAMCAGLVPLLYLELACKVSLVILVVEEDCYGLNSLGRARDLIQGRKVQGFILMALLLLLEEFFSVVFGFDSRREWKQITGVRVVIETFVVVPAEIIVELFGGFVFVVFYHECKKYHGRGNNTSVVGMYSKCATLQSSC